MDKGTAKDFFSHFSGQRERNSEFTVGWLFVSILKKWEHHRHIASPSLQTLVKDGLGSEKTLLYFFHFWRVQTDPKVENSIFLSLPC